MTFGEFYHKAYHLQKHVTDKTCDACEELKREARLQTLKDLKRICKKCKLCNGFCTPLADWLEAEIKKGEK